MFNLINSNPVKELHIQIGSVQLGSENPIWVQHIIRQEVADMRFLTSWGWGGGVLFLWKTWSRYFLQLKPDQIKSAAQTQTQTHSWLSAGTGVTFSNLILDRIFSPSSPPHPHLRLWFIRTKCCTKGALLAKWDSLNGDLYFQDYICIQLQMIGGGMHGGRLVSILFLCLWIMVSFELSGHLVQWVRLGGAPLTRRCCQLPFFPACPHPSLPASNPPLHKRHTLVTLVSHW